MSGAAVRIRGLEKRFGAVVALRGIDLDIEPGSALAVLGPNGAGKSTLLRILAGLAQPTSGHLTLGNSDRDSGKRTRGATRAQVGFVGHATLLYPELTARENLVFAGRLHGVADAGERADTLLEREGFSAVAHRRAGAFSRGMAQRLSIARALVHGPELILLDEPFTGLDQPSAERLGARLSELRQSGHTLVLVTHDLRQAGAIAQAAVVLVRGRIVHRAAGRDVSQQALETAYNAALVGGKRT